MLRFLEVQDFQASVAKKYIDQKFVLQVLNGSDDYIITPIVNLVSLLVFLNDCCIYCESDL